LSRRLVRRSASLFGFRAKADLPADLSAVARSAKAEARARFSLRAKAGIVAA